MRVGKTLALMAFCSLLAADELPSNLMARFVLTLSKMAGQSKTVQCEDSAVGKELKALGVKLDDKAKVAYCTSKEEAAKAFAAKKIVISNDLNLLPKGGSIAIVSEEGKPSIYLHLRHMEDTGAKFANELLHLSNVIRKSEKLK